MSATPKEAPPQLVLELPHRQAQGAEDFLVSHANAAAVEIVDAWPDWSHHAIAVVGPEGAGKSHLANVWRLRSGAKALAAAELGDAAVADMERHHALAIEDVHQGVGNEQTLFHLLNLAREKKYAMLLTSRQAPGELAIALPDLRSRLRALPLVHIDPPDEALLKAVLVKLFADRQLAVEPHIVSYLALHMERSLDAANKVVAAADRLSLVMQRKVTRAIAGEALAQVIGESDRD